MTILQNEEMSVSFEVINGIFYIMFTGIMLSEIKEKFDSGFTINDLYEHYKESGVLKSELAFIVPLLIRESE